MKKRFLPIEINSDRKSGELERRIKKGRETLAERKLKVVLQRKRERKMSTLMNQTDAEQKKTRERQPFNNNR